MKIQDQIGSFIEDLERLLSETACAIDSALLADDFVTIAERSLVIPNMGSKDSQVERHDDSPDTP